MKSNSAGRIRSKALKRWKGTEKVLIANDCKQISVLYFDLEQGAWPNLLTSLHNIFYLAPNILSQTLWQGFLK